MDEFGKNDELDRALREISEQRDRLLGKGTSLPPLRRAALAGALAREFPVEAAFRDNNAQRDQALRGSTEEIPLSVAADLRKRLTSSGRRRAALSAGLVRHPVLVAACVIFALGIVTLGEWGSSSKRSIGEPISRTPVALRLTNSHNQLSLRMSVAELASLRSSFLAANAVFYEAKAEAPNRLRLDLPVRGLLGDDESIRTQ